MTLDALRAQLVIDEGLKLKPYRDSVGKLTIGVGRNLDDVGISIGEAYYLLNNDVARVDLEISSAFTWFAALDPVRRDVLMNMCFNLGLGHAGVHPDGLEGFTQTIGHVARGEYVAAAAGMRASRWYVQVGARGERLAKAMETGIGVP